MTTPPPPYGGYPPPPPGAHGGYYGYPDYPQPYPPPQPTNALAIASLVCAFLFAPLGIIFGHVSLWQIRKTGEGGRGLAIAGLVIGYLITVVTILVVVLTLAVFVKVVDEFGRLDGQRSHYPGVTASPAPPPNSTLPPFNAPKTLGSNCQYPATTEPASKPVKPPQNGRIATDPAVIRATLTTSQGVVGLELSNGKTPCTVNNFTSLAKQQFFDGTVCHRLATADALGMLQCGDPTGTGTGGPGYRFPNEYPTNQYRLTDTALTTPVIYPRGTLAMANAGPGTNGSQFFLVYKDSQLPPTYTVFGTIDGAGLTTLDKIAAAGVADGSDDGRPALDVTIKSVQVG
jgi:peptidyl-prolyl cis-trans isomerase B (cyclophilin B)